MNESPSLAKFAPAFVQAQGQVEGAIRDRTNPHFRSRYADLSSVWDACKAALQAHEIAVIQRCARGVPVVTTGGDDDGPADGGLVIHTRLLHSSGEWIEDALPILSKLLDPQKVGAAITYGRRYGLAAMVGVCPEDDDGEGAMEAYRRPEPRHHDEPRRREPDRRDERPPAYPAGGPPPRTCKALFAFVMEQEKIHGAGLLKYLNGWAKREDFPGRMVDWSDNEVALAYAEALRKLQSREREPGEDG